MYRLSIAKFSPVPTGRQQSAGFKALRVAGVKQSGPFGGLGGIEG